MVLPIIDVQFPPFPPRVTVEEIVQKQLDNNIKNRNSQIHKSQSNFNLGDISKLAAVSWKTEPQQIKNYYKKLAKEVAMTPLIPIYQNYEFLSQNHDYSNSNISLPYSFITPLSGQPSQYIVSDDVNSVNDYPCLYSYEP
ncbi:9826_t:CDS:2 [Diversispora eburnea]|uniref:9826_t:CDS:1 n=1 Tax=Diversispora eburnea TaxID=1213867 RepID=A0A9N9B3W0_9GLOM|nr:9826_t:CDS:2 [Diversispora eburnea]